MLKPGPSRTFEEYSQNIFLPHVKGHLKNVWRVDVVLDMYIPDGPKATIRRKRGNGYTGVSSLTQNSQATNQLSLELMGTRKDSLTTLQAIRHDQSRARAVKSTKSESVVCNGRRDAHLIYHRVHTRKPTQGSYFMLLMQQSAASRR